MSEDQKSPISRRWLLRIGGLLGLSAGAVAVSGASNAAPNAVRPSTPDPTGSFGQPARAGTTGRQAAAVELSRTDAAPGVAEGPQSITSAGSARLTPSRETIDHTPLSRRGPNGSWPIGR